MIQSFGFERPSSWPELWHLLGELGKEPQESFRFFAGGTDLIPTLQELSSAVCHTIVSLTAMLELRAVVSRPRPDSLAIGALTRLCDLIEDPLILANAPILAEVASQIASPQIRNRATVGGNLLVDNRCPYFNHSPHHREVHETCFKAQGDVCNLVKSAKPGDSPLCRARFVSDLAPVLLLMGASLTLACAEGTRKIPLDDFYLEDGIHRNRLHENEILTSIEIRLPPPRHLTYEKLRIRQAFDFPSLGLALSADTIEGAWAVGIAYTGVNPCPVFLRFSEKDFENRARLIDHACNQAARTARPLKQDFFPPSYRREMIEVFIRRGFRHILK